MYSVKELQHLYKSIAFFGCLIAGLLSVPLTITGLDLGFFPGDLGDARFNLYILEHGYQYFQGWHPWYWHAPFMYPVENVVLLSDNLLGTAPLYAAFRWMGIGPISSFQLWFISIFALNYSTAFILLRYLVKDWRAAALAAYIFAFSIALQSQMTHAQVFARFFIPLSILGIIKFTECYKPKYFLLALGAWVGQLYCGIYLGLLSIIPLALCSIWLLFRKPKRLWSEIKKWKWWVAILAISAINILALFKLMWPYYEKSKLLLPTPFNEVFGSLPRPVSYIFAKSGSLCWQLLENTGNYLSSYWDQQIFPGMMAILLSTIFLFFAMFKREARPFTVIILTLVGIVTFMSFLRVKDFSLYSYIYQLPGFGSMRALHRIVGVLLIFLAIPAAYATLWIFQRFKNIRQYVFFFLLLLLITDNYVPEENTYRTKKSIAKNRITSLQNKMRNLQPGTIISYEPDSVKDFIAIQIDAMLAAQSLHLTCINGYSATSPEAFTPYFLAPNEHNRKYWLQSEGITAKPIVIIK